jgi:phage-related protein
MFIIVFYTPAGKTSPIIEYLNSCMPSLRTKILRQLKYVQEFGLNPAIPNIKKITSTSLWELRILGKDNVRIICIALPENRIFVLHIFNKKKQKTPITELNISLNRQKMILDK